MSALGIAFIVIAVFAGVEGFVGVGLIMTGQGSGIIAVDTITGFLALVLLAASGNVLYQAAKVRRQDHDASAPSAGRSSR
jgi:hypothetical protein